MTLVNTSIWVEHLRRGHAGLAGLLDRGEVQGHPFVLGELACGNLIRRPETLGLLATLPYVAVAHHEEVLALVERERLSGRGLGWIDVHLRERASLPAGQLLRNGRERDSSRAVRGVGGRLNGRLDGRPGRRSDPHKRDRET